MKRLRKKVLAALFACSLIALSSAYLNKHENTENIRNVKREKTLASKIGSTISTLATAAIPIRKNNSEELKKQDTEIVYPYNLLLIGNDIRPKERAPSSDALHLFHFTKQNLVLFSIPRDTKVSFPGHDEPQKINHSLVFGGPELTIKTLESLLNIKIDSYVEADFNTFKLVAGLIYRDTDELLKWLRNRNFAEGDLARVKRHQIFLKKAIKDCMEFRENHPRVFEANLKIALEWLDTNLEAKTALALAENTNTNFNKNLENYILPGKGARIYTPLFKKELSYYIPSCESNCNFDELIEKLRAERYKIVIDKSDFSLCLYENEQSNEKRKLLKEYKIAFGEKTPLGSFKILNKMVNPSWTPSLGYEWISSETRNYVKKHGTVPAGSKLNPLNGYWLGIGNGIGIHGTNKPESIGTIASHGCIRMHEKDVKELASFVNINTEVKIQK